MLSHNIKKYRISRGLSQEDVAEKLHVVRQTVSKWEKDLSVPDAYMLMNLSQVLDVPVHVLLGDGEESAENQDAQEQQDVILALSEKLEKANAALADMQEKKRRQKRTLFILVGGLSLLTALICFFGMWGLELLLNVPAQSIGIIGGADGPTAIFVARSYTDKDALCLAICALIVCAGCIIGIFRNRKK